MTKPPNPELVKAIKGAAVELLLEKGAKGVKIRKIADMVGVTATTIYYYFENKNELMRKVSIMVFDDFNRYVDSKLKGDTPPERLISLRKAIFQYAVENPNIFELLFSRKYVNPEAGKHEDEAIKTYYYTYYLAISIINDGIKHGYFECDDPHIVASATISYIYGLFELYISKRIPPPYANEPYKLASYFDDLINDNISKKEKKSR
ncbi:MAG: TetR/AcrR family transcriptional regulator [bacterium]|nr:TetR/AcrR family transcriptional regulator [bacterium]